jgi:WD40 repeat protein
MRALDLQQILLQSGYVAQTPSAVRILSALKTGRTALLEFLPADSIDALVKAAQDPDDQIAREARSALLKLRDPETQDALCRLVVEKGDPQAELAAIQARYEPKDPGERALFYFITGQWQKYEALDFDRGLLSALYANASSGLRKRLLASLQRAGRTDFLSVVAGGNFHSRAALLGDEETEILIGMLASNQEWSRLWNLALDLPFRWSVRILQILKSSSWQPEAAEEMNLYQILAALVSRSLLDDKSSGENILPPAVLRSTIRVSGRINDIVFAPNGSQLAIASSLGKIAIWDFRRGKLSEMVKGFAHSLGCLAYTQNGDLFSGERSLTSIACGIYRISNGQLTLLGSHRGAITALAAAGSGKILSTGRDQLVRIWDLDSRRVAVEKTFHFWPRSARISAEGQTAALLHESITLVSLPTLDIQPFSPFQIRRSYLSETRASMARCALFTPDNKQLLVGQNNGQVIRYEPRATRLSAGRTPVTHHPGVIQGLEMISGHSVLVSAGSEGGVNFLDWPSQHLLGHLSIPVERLTTLSLSNDGAFMAVGDAASKFTLWDLRVLDIPVMISRPIASATLPQLAALDSLSVDPGLPTIVRMTLQYIQAILRHRFQYDIEVSEPLGIRPGEFDILIDGAST